MPRIVGLCNESRTAGEGARKCHHEWDLNQQIKDLVSLAGVWAAGKSVHE